MAIKTRETNGTGVTNKDAPLTNAEVDNNFIELVAEDATKLDLSGGTLTGNVTTSGLFNFGDSTAITNNRLRLGTGGDLKLYHNGVDSFVENVTGLLTINNASGTGDVKVTAHDSQSASTTYFQADASEGEAQLYHLGSKKLVTKSTGVETTGTISLNGAYTFPTSDGSANQVLQTDGSGTLSFADPASQGVTVQDEGSNLGSTAGTTLNFVGAGVTATGNGATKTITIAGGSSGLSNVVEDTTPELGGTLEADGYNIEFTDSSATTDGRAKFGTGDDLQIYHDGNRSYIENTGGPLMIEQSSGDDIVFKNLKASPSTSLTTYLGLDRSTGQVNAYHYGSLKLETKSTGIQVNGTITLTDGLGNTTYAFPTADGSANQVLQTDGSGSLSFADPGLPTTGGTMTGNLKLNDNVELQVGSGSPDFRIRHNATHTQIQNYTGQLQITNFTDDSDVRILTDDGSGGSTDYFRADGSNGEVVLYHYGSEKLATKSTGVQTTGTLNVNGAYTLPTSDGSANQVLQTDGSGTLSFATVSGGGGSGISNVVEDTTPELGGTLDLNGQTITQSVGAVNIENQNSNKNINLSVGQGHTTFAVTGSGVQLDDSNKTAKFGGDGSTGGVTLANGYVDIRGKSVSEATYVNFYCESSNAHAVKLQAPAHADFSGNITTTLPNTTGTLVTSNAQRRIEVVSSLPSSPDSNTIYFVT